MKTSKESLRTGLIVWLTVLVVTACGWSREPEPAAEPVTLNFITLLENSTGEQEVLNQYALVNPHVTIEREGYAQFPQQYLLAEPQPDLMGMGPSHILFSAIQQDLLMDITDLWARSGLLDSYPNSFQAMTEHGGKQYYLPVGYGWTALYYNRALFDQLGVTPPQTWSELISTADSLLANGVTPFSIAGQDPVSASLWFDYLNLRVNGPEFHRSLIRGEESYDDPRVRQVFEIWQMLFASRYFVENAASMSSLESLTATIRRDEGQLGRHKAAMVLTTPFEIAELPETFRPELDFFRFPTVDPSVIPGEVLPSVGYMIPADAPNRLAALDLLSYLSSADAQQMLFQPGSAAATFVPVNKDIDRDSYSSELNQGMTIIEGADHVMQQYFWSSPTTLQSALATALRTFLREAGDSNANIDNVLLRLEEARQKAVTEQVFGSR